MGAAGVRASFSVAPAVVIAAKPRPKLAVGGWRSGPCGGAGSHCGQRRNGLRATSWTVQLRCGAPSDGNANPALVPAGTEANTPGKPAPKRRTYTLRPGGPTWAR